MCVLLGTQIAQYFTDPFFLLRLTEHRNVCACLRAGMHAHVCVHVHASSRRSEVHTEGLPQPFSTLFYFSDVVSH